MLYGYNNGRRTYCRCLCDCGNEKIICVEHLKRRENPSCGCMTTYYRTIHNRTNEIGKKYGRLTIVDIDYSVRPSIAKCICDCGKRINANKAEVIYGHTRSCGCLQSEKISKRTVKDFTNCESESGVRIIERDYKNKRGVWIWKCICPICGNTFSALPAKVLSNHTTSCGCQIQSSKERIIESYLKKVKANYKRQVRFNDCRYKYTLPFDFAVYDNNNNLKFLIEYDGLQHFKETDFFGGKPALEEVKKRDKIKTDYCDSKNIKLLRFNYKNTNDEIYKQIINTIYP